MTKPTKATPAPKPAKAPRLTLEERIEKMMSNHGGAIGQMLQQFANDLAREIRSTKAAPAGTELYKAGRKVFSWKVTKRAEPLPTWQGTEEPPPRSKSARTFSASSPLERIRWPRRDNSP